MQKQTTPSQDTQQKLPKNFMELIQQVGDKALAQTQAKYQQETASSVSPSRMLRRYRNDTKGLKEYVDKNLDKLLS